MPRYHFNVLDGVAELDAIGTELADIKAAKREARRYAGNMLSDSANQSDPDDEWRVEVTDATGMVLLRLDIMMSEAVALRGKAQ